MAIQEACSKCDSYKSGICTRLWKEPPFDGTPCTLHTYPNKNDDKHVLDSDDNREEFTRKIHKRGSSATGHSVKTVVGQREVKGKSTPPKARERQVYVGYRTFRLLEVGWHVLSVCLIATIIIGGYFGWRHYRSLKEKDKKEELVMEAKRTLYSLIDDNTFRYLQLISMDFKDNSLYFRYYDQANMVSAHMDMISHLMTGQDSINRKSDNMLSFFLSTMAIRQQEWNTACQLLDSADVDVEVIFIPINDTCTIGNETLRQIHSMSEPFRKGIKLFIWNKQIEVKTAALSHFFNDRFFGIDSVSLSPDFVTLHLNFDDTYNLSDSYLDTSYINPHFIDPVNETGSIVDNMLTICSLKNCGFAFEYVGRKKHQTFRWEWDSDRTQEFLKDYPGYISYSGRKTNQVHTGIVRKR